MDDGRAGGFGRASGTSGRAAEVGGEGEGRKVKAARNQLHFARHGSYVCPPYDFQTSSTPTQPRAKRNQRRQEGDDEALLGRGKGRAHLPPNFHLSLLPFLFSIVKPSRRTLSGFPSSHLSCRLLSILLWPLVRARHPLPLRSLLPSPRRLACYGRRPHSTRQ